MFAWVRSRQAGCKFASALATQQESRYWRPLVTRVPQESDDLDSLQDVLEGASAAPEIHALMVVLEDVELPSDLTRLISGLCSHPSWTCCEPTAVKPSIAGRNRFSVGLRWRMPSGELAFVLGFGPFGFLPPTRRAPYCALTIPTCEHSQLRGGSAEERHLCDMREERFDGTIDIDGESRNQWDYYWAETEQWRDDLVSEYDEEAAKARVTFVLPESLRSEITVPLTCA